MGSSLLRRFVLQRSFLSAPRCFSSSAAALPQPIEPQEKPDLWSYFGGSKYCRTVVVSSQLDSIQPKHLLMQIERLPSRNRTESPFLVLFLTPTFAHWLSDDQTFLCTALRRLLHFDFRDSHLERSYHALVAVVDRLPVPAYPGRGYKKGQQSTSTSPSPPFSEIGFEGMAYALLDEGQLLTSHLEALHEPMGEVLRQKPGTINIHIDASVASASLTPMPRSVLQLPLANTIFHTGHPSTMFLTSWRKEKGSKDLNLISKEHLQHGSFAWPDLHNYGLQSASLSVPLTPITIPRRIEAGMGNIIRRIQGENSQSFTASQELEETVPRYFAAKNIPARAMKVWALVIPKNLIGPVTAELTSRFFGSDTAAEDVLDLNAAFQELWKNDRPVWNDAVSFAISHGARLHRVLSGGGGWGKKAGLLSLDPETSYDDPTLTSSDSEIDMLELFDVEKSALKEVAEPGEFIQFFVPGPEDIGTLKREVSKHLDDPQTFPVYLELGTIPSTVDHIPDIEQQSRAPIERIENSIHVFRGHFGALSEGGMSIVRGDFDGKQEVQIRSKIDVALSRFTALQFFKKDEVSAMLDMRTLRMAENIAKKAERTAKIEARTASRKLSGSASRTSSKSTSIRKLASALTTQSVRFSHEDDNTIDAEHQGHDVEVSEDAPEIPFRNPAIRTTTSPNRDLKNLLKLRIRRSPFKRVRGQRIGSPLASLDSEVKFTRRARGVVTRRVKTAPALPVKNVSEKKSKIRYHVLGTRWIVHEDTRKERIRQRRSGNKNVIVVKTPSAPPFEIRSYYAREKPKNRPRRRASKGMSRRTGEHPTRPVSHGLKSRLHQITGSVVPEQARREVFTAVWERRLKGASERGRAMPSANDKDVLMVKVPIQGEDGKDSREISHGGSLRAQWFQGNRDRIRTIEHSDVPPETLGRTRSIRPSPRNSYGKDKSSQPVRKMLTNRTNRLRLIKNFSLRRNRPRKVLAIGSSLEQKGRRISDPEVAQLIDEVESWLAWDAKPPS
ncbi:hypothetical protein BU16DRAFT_555077 [Lophium mytilinum]|uniref:Uncharacterized protein n=1 Tax=Lophium mytilinum TaxID=390894 RepID=A0A6A6REE4_9PEZI|nr:hypothetical protein BU16DRAFT_555077 [Lophium mytilinum]